MSSKTSNTNNRDKAQSNSSKNMNSQSNKNKKKKYPPRRRGPVPGKNADGEKQVDVEDEAEEEDHNHCLICYGDLKHRGLVKCGHDDICGMCHLRLRMLHEDVKCPVCKTNNDHVIISAEETTKTFQDYPMWNDNDIGPQFTFHKNMFFPHSYYEQEVKPLFSLSCTICPDFTNEQDTYICPEVPSSDNNTNNNNNNNNKNNKKKVRLAGLDALQQHLRADHSPSLTLCNLCVENKVDFISQLPRMTAGQLKKHNNDPKRGHPLCRFCNKRFYDLQALHDHLNKEHYKCHMCETNMGLKNQFYKDYKSLETHFQKAHYPCLHPDCMAARFVVFSNEIDLQAHMRTIHNDILGKSTKLQLEFRVRRSTDTDDSQQHQSVPSSNDFSYTLDGQVFVPDSLQEQQQENEPVITHEAHAQRTAQLRQEAQRIRSNQQQAEAFPSLTTTNANQTTASIVGWNSSMVRPSSRNPMSQDNFPSLPTAAPATSSLRRKPAASSITNSLASMRLKHRPQMPSSSSSTTSWSSSKPPSFTTASTATRPTAASTSTIASRVAGATAANKASNLAANNFPSLPAPTATVKGTTNGKKPYLAAQSLAAKLQKSSSIPQSTNAATTTGPSWGGGGTKVAIKSKTNNSTKNLTMSNFPTLPATKTNTNSVQKMKQQKKSLNMNQDYAAAEAFFAKQQQLNQKKNHDDELLVRSSLAKGALSSTMAVPTSTIVSSSSSKKPVDDRKVSAKKNANTNDKKQFPPLSGKELVAEMKSTMGPTKYKQLKQWTQQLAQSNMPGQNYIDNACTLFDDGILDDLFWNFIPPLLQSCPAHSAEQALSYMESLRFAQVLQQREYSAEKR